MKLCKFKQGGSLINIKDGKKSTKVAFLGMLFALALLLSFLEYNLPGLSEFIALVPPGIKLGLSNIVTMYCLFSVGAGSAITVALLKSLFVVLMRGPVSGFMSLCGGLLSVLVMFAILTILKQDSTSMMLSVAGSIFHNIGQLIGTMILLKTQFALYYVFVLIISGTMMGVITGIILRAVMPALDKTRLKL